MSSIYVYGKTGRIGQLLLKYINQFQLSLVDHPKDALVSILAVPRHVVPKILNDCPSPSIIDMSGYSKKNNIGVYAANIQAYESKVIQNPGCFASSVIQAFKRAPIDAHNINGGIHITTIGGSSVAHRTEEHQVRLAKRFWSHPHVQEIKKIFSDIQIQSFVPIINHHQPHGILTTISGRLHEEVASVQDDKDISSVWGSDNVTWELRVHKKQFVLISALDNLHFPASYAVQLAMKQGGRLL